MARYGSRSANAYMARLTTQSDNVYAPSAIPWNDKHASPKEMSLDDIDNLKVRLRIAIVSNGVNR